MCGFVEKDPISSFLGELINKACESLAPFSCCTYVLSVRPCGCNACLDHALHLMSREERGCIQGPSRKLHPCPLRQTFTLRRACDLHGFTCALPATLLQRCNKSHQCLLHCRRTRFHGSAGPTIMGWGPRVSGTSPSVVLQRRLDMVARSLFFNNLHLYHRHAS